MRKIISAIVMMAIVVCVFPFLSQEVSAESVSSSEMCRYVVTLDDYSRSTFSEPLVAMSHCVFKTNLSLTCQDADTIYEFNSGLSGFSVSCTPESAKTISGFDGVESVHMVRYVYPHLFESVETTGASEVWDMVDELDGSITGEGVLVGIIDTGIHYHHPSISDGFGPDKRVCVGYDFYNMDPDPYPDNDSYHGSHCAGIVGANGMPGIASGESTPKGIAPGVKLGAYKVFGGSGGAPYDAIMAAIEQAYEDECDIVNLSLGSEYVWADEPYCRMIDNFVDKGMVVVASAGNAGRNSREDLPFQLSSPGGADHAICVAAMNDSGTTIFFYGDSYIEPVFMSYSKGVYDEIIGDLVYCDIATEEHVKKLDLDGKIALVKRGDLTFYDKAKNVENQGAVACIVFNNKEGDFGGTLGSDDIGIPVISVSDTLGAELMELEGETCKFMKDDRLGLMADFSSAGPTNDYRMKPDMSAPGKRILSTVGNESYIQMSGTSMASPMVAGGAALIKQAHPDWSAHDIRSALINYSKPQKDLKDNFHQILSQGTGRMYLPWSVNAPTLFKPTSLSVGWITEPVTQSITVKNTTDSELTLSVSMQENGLEPVSIGELTIDEDSIVDFEITLGENTDEGQHVGYLLFDDGEITARVPYLYYIGQQPTVETMSHIQVHTPVVSPDDDENLERFRARVSINEPVAGIEYVMLDENRKVEKILDYSYGYISGGMWDFSWDGTSDHDFITEGKHYWEFYTMDFGLDPTDSDSWVKNGEFEFIVTTTPPEVQIDELPEVIYNEGEFTLTGQIIDPLLSESMMGDEGIITATLYGLENPTQIELMSEGRFELDLPLSPGKNNFGIYVVNAGEIESFVEFQVTALSTMNIKLEETLLVDSEPTSIEIVMKDDAPFVSANSLVDIQKQVAVAIEGERVCVHLGQSSITMMIGEPLMITENGVSFCERPYVLEDEVMVPIEDLLEGFGAEFDEKESSWTVVWVEKP